MISKKFIPNGVADIHFNEYQRKEKIITRIKEIYKIFGYRQILTPTFEYYDLFYGIEGTINLDEMIKMIDENGKILVLRPDVTTPIARMAATNYQSCAGSLKFSYVTNIFRMSDEKNDNKREFTQAGIEYLGNDKVESDGEVISLAIRSLLDCGVKDFKIDIGQITFFKGLLKDVDLSIHEKKNIRSLVEKKNFPELERVIKEVDGKQEAKDALLAMPHLYGKPKDALKRARQYICNVEMEEAIENLSELCDVLIDYGYEDYFDIDLGLVNSLDYYSGLVFKGYISHHGKEILSGGRYDHLIEQYGFKMSATGYGLNIDELLKAMTKYECDQEDTCYSDYLILFPVHYRKKGLFLAEELRKKGFVVETDSFTGEIMPFIENAHYRSIRELIRIEDEKVQIVNIETRKSYKTSIEEMVGGS